MKLSFGLKGEVIETLGVGTLIAVPSSFPSNSGITVPIVFAAPVEVGIIARAAARHRYKSSWRLSNVG